MIYIILPVHNRVETTLTFINSLQLQTIRNFTLILIDDGSKDNTSEKVTQIIPNTIVIYGNGNLWWAGCINKAYQWISQNALTDSLTLIINDDVILPNDFLENGLKLMHSTPESLILASSINIKTNEFKSTGIYANFNNFTFTPAKNRAEINCLSTRGLFLWTSDFLSIGKFHQYLLPHYWSDYNFTIRAKNKGFSLKTYDNFFLYENTETTGIHEFTSPSFLYYIKTLFSKRCVQNPIYSLTFLLLSAPAKKIFPCTAIIIRSMFIQLIKQITRSLSHYFNIFHFLKYLKFNDSKKIILGAGGTKQKGWLSCEIDTLNILNKENFPENLKNVKCILAEHVWEHLNYEEGLLAAKNCYSILSINGNLRIAVPDGYHPDKSYIAAVDVNGSGSGASDHKVLYNYTTLSKILLEAGFSVTKLEWFDENGIFHNRHWDSKKGYIYRSSLNDYRNKVKPLTYTSLIIDAIKLN